MQVRGTIQKMVLSALLIGATGALSACVVNDGYSRGGYDDDDYPPARPRHGYRYAYPGGLTLIYDSGIGLYSVFGYPDYYFHDGYFYRWQSGYWNRARHWNRGWERCDSRRWPRPIYYVNDNYYRHGRRPHHDWDRDWDRDHRGRRDRDYIDNVRDATEDARRREREAQREQAEHRRDDGYTNRVRDAQEKAQRREEERRRELSEELRERSRESDPVDHLRHPDPRDVRRDDGQRQVNAIREASAQRERERGERDAVEQAVREQRREEKAARQEQREDSRERSDGGGERGERSEDSRHGGARGDNWQDHRDDRR